jgi:hypothetical protein
MTILHFIKIDYLPVHSWVSQCVSFFELARSTVWHVLVWTLKTKFDKEGLGVPDMNTALH